jgi:hypothetical protein
MRTRVSSLREEDEFMDDDECDCHECISGNPDKCLETDWSGQCCDGSDPNCCGRPRDESVSPVEADPVGTAISKIFERPKRRSIHDLEKDIDHNDRQIFVEERDERTGRPKIWYLVDSSGHVNRWERMPEGIIGHRLGKAPYIDQV